MSHSLPSIQCSSADKFVLALNLNVVCKRHEKKKEKKLYVCITTIIRNIYMA